MKKKYHICNNVYVKYTELIKSDFDISPVWVEHNIPEELNYIKKRGVTDEWIEQYFYEEILDDSHPFYTIIGDYNYFKFSEFVYLGCVLNIKDNIFHGYVTIFDNYLTIVNLFHYGKTLSFYLNNLFEEENFIFIKKAEKIIENNFEVIQINLKIELERLGNKESNLMINYKSNKLTIRTA